MHIVELSQPGTLIGEIHLAHEVLVVADLAPGPLDFRLRMEIVVKVGGKFTETLRVVLRHGLHRHTLKPQLAHELKNLGVFGVR